MDTLAIGAYQAIRFRGPQGAARVQPLAPWEPALSCATIAPVMLYQKGYGHTRLVTMVGFSCNAVLAGACLALTLAPSGTPILSKTFSYSTLRFLGKYSYCLYIIHEPVAQIVCK